MALNHFALFNLRRNILIDSPYLTCRKIKCLKNQSVGSVYFMMARTYAQYHFYSYRKLGWLTFSAFHQLIENFLREQGFTNYKISHLASLAEGQRS